MNQVGGERGQPFRALTALPEDPGSVPAPRQMAEHHNCLIATGICTHMVRINSHKYTQIHIQIEIFLN